ncbi:UNVERIFIED_CONTAM: putative E3 ubiquitin-protein ligase XBAT35 [Sesamum radiatum]|uniref:E3 ubiquitin-protein ligase XBAT35 n=1 Tax=Sesamum radiatum TaxID=300843 RepID=A0AAW2SJW5_SESRA
MGQQQSKDELLYQQVNYGNVEGIKALRSQGAGLEWIDSEGKTALVLACMNPELYNVAKTLIELGANINVYRPGRHAGTPLHHAAKRGLEHTVKLLLSHGANPLVMNDDCQTPLDVARAKGWVVILPCGSRNLRKPLKLELAIYSGLQVIFLMLNFDHVDQDAQPRTTIPLWKANLEEPNFNQPDPAAVISDFSKSTRIKLAPVHENEKNQLQRFCNACKGIPQVTHPLFPFNNQVPTAPAPNSEDEELAMAINASLQSAAHQRPPHTDTYIGSGTDASTSTANSMNSPSHQENYTTGPASTSHETSGSKCEVQEAGSTSSSAKDSEIYNHVLPVVQPTLENPSLASMPSAPPAVDAANYDGPILYPSIDMSPVDLSSPNVDTEPSRVDEKNKDSVASSCTICLDAPLEGACIPCGHMAGCMSCLNEIKAKKWGCPVCRAKINQVVRIYAV